MQQGILSLNGGACAMRIFRAAIEIARDEQAIVS